MSTPVVPPTGNAGSPSGDYVLVLDCPDRPGIVHAVSGFLLDHGGNIMESQQFFDRANGQFFMRIDKPGHCIRRCRLANQIGNINSEEIAWPDEFVDR